MGRGSQCVRPSNSDHQVDAFYEPRVASGTLLRSSLSSSLLQVPSGFSGTSPAASPVSTHFQALRRVLRAFVVLSFLPRWLPCVWSSLAQLHWPEEFLSALILVARCLRPGSLFLHTRKYFGLLFLARLVPMGTATPWARFQAPCLEKPSSG